MVDILRSDATYPQTSIFGSDLRDFSANSDKKNRCLDGYCPPVIPESSVRKVQLYGCEVGVYEPKIATCNYPVIKLTKDATRSSNSSSPKLEVSTLVRPSYMKTVRSDPLEACLDLSRRREEENSVSRRSVPRDDNQKVLNFGRPIVKRRRLRTVFSDKQLAALEVRFISQKYMSTVDRESMAKSLGLTQMQVKTWYQNRRMRWKKAVLAGECVEELSAGDVFRRGKGRPRVTALTAAQEASADSPPPPLRIVEFEDLTNSS
ncbi:putative Homeobox protein BarH-like 2 [Hypsibius exemplaris]|uniref:Homeobox protein BarH-like 2 n=1 Tax=Hypsibius exemplaris TaxID=2072580 RepID=A0A1W0WRR4_HYPEX|nr:putative Homeobox protein BarH-like 2 [Hypsibius exemplaris]